MNKKILILLAIIFLVNISVVTTYSMYRTTRSGTGTLNAATWSISSTGSSNSISLVAGEPQTYTLNVRNDSEVDVKYTIVIDNIPNTVQVKLDSGSYVTPTNNKITFSNAGELLYGGTITRNHTLTFLTPLSTAETSNQSLSINVEFAQKS